MTPTIFRVEISRRAAENLESIFEFLSQNSPQYAAAFEAKLNEAFNSLESLPHKYRVVQPGSKLRPDVRLLVVDSYLVYYRVYEAQKIVVVVTVRHGARRRLKRI